MISNIASVLVISAVFFGRCRGSSDLLLERHERSIEGQRCGKEHPCSLAYTICNEKIGICECDRRISVRMTMPLFPEVTQCIPFEYTNSTGLCLPTNPDICSLLFPGSFCDTSKRDGTHGKMRCACQIGGQFPNCVVRVGSICSRDDVCTKDIPDSFCGNISNGFGKCTCGTIDAKGFVSNREGTLCKPTNCAAKPCFGDAAASTCIDSASGYECRCNNNTKGRSHDFSVRGICCNEDSITCGDFSKCIKVTEICNGVADCDDCSDEMQLYCTGPLPMKEPKCFRNDIAPGRLRLSNDINVKETPVVVAQQQPVFASAAPTNPSLQAAIQVAQAAASSGLNTLNDAGNNRQVNPYARVADVIRTGVPSLGIPAVGLGVLPAF